MERLRFRSTSLLDLQAELRQQDLLSEISQPRAERAPRRHSRALPFSLRALRRRLAL